MSTRVRERQPSAEAPFSVFSLLDRQGRLSLFKFCRLSKHLLRMVPMFGTYVSQQHGFSDCSPSASCQTAENTKSQEIEHLFPMSVPPRPSCLHVDTRGRLHSSRRRARWSNRYLAWQFAELIVAACNTWYLEGPDARPPVSGPPSALQAAAFEQLVQRLMILLRPFPAVSMGTGRGNVTLNRMIDAFSARWGFN